MTQETAATCSVLSKMDCPSAVSKCELEELQRLAEELRKMIITTVSVNGGHLAPSLGVVELTLALLSKFDLSKDKIIWDVGHQAYAYKILTGRRDTFHTLRTLGGISGFPRRAESPYDQFGVGHSSTSISAALGMAMGRDLAKTGEKVVAIIGDGSMTAGLAFEGLNQAGHMGRDCIVVLNDNEMSISPNVGALSSFLSRNLSKRWLLRIKKETENWVRQIPTYGPDIVEYLRKSEGSLKGLFTPGMLFEALRFNYIGPIDGHDLEQLLQVFGMVRDLEGPVLVHVMTKKGKGYAPAEQNPTYFHGVGSFEPETGKAKKYVSAGQVALPSYTEVFGKTLLHMAEKDPRIVAITAAMPEGTGLAKFAEKFPDRFVDVGICEQHAVTFAAGLAVKGFKPVVAIYSTFLQRSYDQILHDVCLQNLNVTFCLDRGGLVGEDGATHHGVFDFSYLRHIPNITVMAPKDEAELQRLLMTAMEHDGPLAIRYPRGVGVGAPLYDPPEAVEVGTGELLREGSDALILAIGSRVHPCLEAAEEIEKENGASVGVYNARCVKPLPMEMLELASRAQRLMLVEENALAGGFSSAVLEGLCDNDLLDVGGPKKIKRIGIPDAFVEHGAQKLLREQVGLDQNGIKRSILELLQS